MPLAARLHDHAHTGPDPDAAPARLERFLATAADLPGGLAACVPDAQAERLLGLLLHQSPALARTLASEPMLLAALRYDPYLEREKSEAAMLAELHSAIAQSGDLFTGLRRYCRREFLRIGARELGWGTFEEVGRELTHLAGACLDAALQHLIPELETRLGPPLTDQGTRCRFVVFGMGKLGGEELNFSSDIDLLYVYETDDGIARGSQGGTSLHEWFSALATRLSRALEQVTGEGSCFRVDLRLRPEGTRGPLVNALPALERYYESWGRAWERQAWIKARAVAGDRDLGDEVLRTLTPFVWPRTSFAGGQTAVDAVRDMVRLLAQARAASTGANDVKLGYGGIREVEFFAQALQLIHGGRQSALRTRGTLPTLDQLLFAGLLSEREHRQLGDAYLFLRRIEHRLQLEELRQTHTIADTPKARALLARRLGFINAETFDARLDAERNAVAAIFATLGDGEEVATAVRPPGAVPLGVQQLLDPQSDEAVQRAALAALGFQNIDACLDEIMLLVTKPRSPFAYSAPDPKRAAAAELLAEATSSPDPDLALRRLVDLVTRGRAADGVWRLASEHRALGRLLVNLFGTSDFLAKSFLASPDLVEPLLAAPRKAHDMSHAGRQQHRQSIAQRLSQLPKTDEETRFTSLRRYQRSEILRIGLADIAGELDLAAVSAELSQLAQACIQAALEIVLPAVCHRFQVAATDAAASPPAPALAVIGLGKLGSAEMTYSSDLDLIFVFDDQVPTGNAPPFEFHARLVQRLIRGLEAYLSEGRLYEVDTRLRPSGQKGALVCSLEGFREYHAQAAALWERQALIRARFIAGDGAVGAAVERIAAAYIWEGPTLDPAAAAEIGRLRARMERELANELPERGRFHIKAGRGGLVDIEFLTQYLQLLHGPSRPEVRVRPIQSALDALHRAGLLAPDDHQQLISAYQFLRRLENRLRIVHDRSIAELPERDRLPGELDKLARRLGYRGPLPGTRLLDDYLQHTEQVRAIYQRFLPLA